MFDFIEKYDGKYGCDNHSAGVEEKKSEYYDGATLRDGYGENYRPEGSKPHCIETRVFRQQVRDEKRRVDLLKNRMQYRKEAGLETGDVEQELAAALDNLKLATAEVAEEISKLGDVDLEMVLAKRYIDTLSWDEVAKTLDIKMRTVQRLHGRALPRMQRVLLQDGLVELEDEGGSSCDSDDSGEPEDSEDPDTSGAKDMEEPDDLFND